MFPCVQIEFTSALTFMVIVALWLFHVVSTTHDDPPWRCHHSNVAIGPTFPSLLPMSCCMVIKGGPTFIVAFYMQCSALTTKTSIVLTTHTGTLQCNAIALTVSHGEAISSHLKMTSETMDLGFNTQCAQQPFICVNCHLTQTKKIYICKYLESFSVWFMILASTDLACS